MEPIDHYSAYHKGLRRKLFAFSVLLGRVDWSDAAEFDPIAAHWQNLLDRLELHGEHEEHFLHPLFEAPAPELRASLEHDHDKHDTELAALDGELRSLIECRDAVQRRSRGLAMYRRYQRFLAEYLLHLDAEEERAVPVIQQFASADDAIAAQIALQRSLTPEQTLDSVISMLCALPHSDAEVLLAKVREVAPALVQIVTDRVAHEALVG